MVFVQHVPATVTILPTRSGHAFKIYIRNVTDHEIKIKRPRGFDLEIKETVIRRFSRKNENFIITDFPAFVYGQKALLALGPRQTRCFTIRPDFNCINKGLYTLRVQYNDDYLDSYGHQAGITECIGYSRDFIFTGVIRKANLSQLKFLRIEKASKHEPRHEESRQPLPPAKIG